MSKYINKSDNLINKQRVINKPKTQNRNENNKFDKIYNLNKLRKNN